MTIRVDVVPPTVPETSVLVKVQEVALVGVYVRVEEYPKVMDVGEAVRVTVGGVPVGVGGGTVSMGLTVSVPVTGVTLLVPPGVTVTV